MRCFASAAYNGRTFARALIIGLCPIFFTFSHCCLREQEFQNGSDFLTPRLGSFDNLQNTKAGRAVNGTNLSESCLAVELSVTRSGGESATDIAM